MNSEGWAKNVFRPLVVGAMMGCIALSLVDLIHLFFPGWSGTYMVVACVLAAVEANYSYGIIRRSNLRGGDVVRFRASEVALLFVLVRVGSLVGMSWAAVWADVRAWPWEPWRILDLEIGYAFILTLLSWTASTRTTYDLDRIGEPPVRDKYYVYPVDALTSRFFWGGAMLLWIAGITRIGISALLNLSRPSVPGLVLNVLLYFALGLAMLGQIQYARLSQRWRKEGIDVPRGLAAHWVRYTLLFVGLTGLIVFLLPTGYTLPLLEVISIAVGAVLYVFNVIFQLAVALFLLIFMPLARLLGADLQVEPPPDPIPPLQVPPPQTGVSAPGWLEVARSISFWILTIAVVVYVVRSYLHDRPELTEALGTLKWVGGFRRFLLGIWRRLTGLARAARERLPTRPRLRPGRTDREGAPAKGPFRFFLLGKISRRQRTLYYYLSILRRAAREGYPRRRSQTPYEYDAHLGPEMPQAESEMDRLTDAFVETRYSTHPIGQEQERRVRADWRRVRAALRSLRERSDAGEGSGTKPA